MTDVRFEETPRTGNHAVDRALQTVVRHLVEYDDEVQAALALKQAINAALTAISGLDPDDNSMLIYLNGAWTLIDPPTDGIGNLYLIYNDSTDTVEWGT